MICATKCYFGYASLISRNDMLRNGNKVFTAAPSSVGFAATFSPRAKALTAVLFYTKGVCKVPFQGMFRLRLRLRST